MYKKIVFPVLGLFLCGWAFTVWAQEATTQSPASEKRVAKIDLSSSKKDSITVSPDCRRVAFEAEVRFREFVVVDGKEGKPYDRVSYIKFSPDSKRVAHLAKSGEKWMIVIDGREERPYDQVTFPVFSPDSRHLAYMAKEGGNWFLVLDGKEGPRYGYDDLLYMMTLSYPPRFSPDSRRIPYFARADKKFFLVVDGKEEKRYDYVAFPTFSADGKLAYNATVGNKTFVVINGKEGDPYDSIGVPQFSPDGTRLAYDVRAGNRAFLVIDGKEEKSYEGINKSPIFSPDGRHLAYGVKSGDRELIVIDGKEERVYDATGFPRFSPDGNRVAYPAKRGNRWLMVDNGKEGKEYDYVHRPNFSPDSRLLAYRVKTGNKVKVVLGGKEGKEYDEVLGDLLVDMMFDSPQRLHYLARRGNDISLVEEGTAGPEKGERVKETEPAKRKEEQPLEPRVETRGEGGKETGKGGALERGSLAENFNQNRSSLFKEVEEEDYLMTFTDESFLWFLKKPNLMVWQIGPESGFNRFVAEVDLWRVEGPRNGGFGFYVKRKGSEEAWWAGISSNGYYQVQKRSSGKIEGIKKWTRSPFILGKRHRFKLEVQPGAARLFVDGNPVSEVKDGFIQGGLVGLYAATPDLVLGPEDQGGLKIKFDNFSLEYEREPRGEEMKAQPPVRKDPAPDPSVPAPAPQRSVSVKESKEKRFPEGIDPKQTSDDPTYGYTLENPVKVGGPKGYSGPQSERLYLEHLRDSNFNPLKFRRAGSFGMTTDNHIVDGYELISEDGKKYFIYMDMYHPEIHPLQVKAPKGLYLRK